MIEKLRKHADQIIEYSIRSVLPDKAVARAFDGFCRPKGRLVLLAAGKAAWQMASAAVEALGGVDEGMVITKYGHVKGDIPGVTCFEAGHPVPDENGFEATKKALGMVSGLSADDTVIFLLSGGGSALFEYPLIPGEELADITEQLLASGAGIIEINTVRKRLSGVKGGKFALACASARVYSVILSDVLGDRPDMIASGPAYPDASTCAEAQEIAERYGLRLSDKARALLSEETPKELANVETVICGSAAELCEAAAVKCGELGYRPVIITDCLDCEASDAGHMLSSLAKEHSADGENMAFIAGGETVVHLRGKGLGGRNQETALAAAEGIAGLDAAVFSVGSDGTDGPTDAAGGYVDGETTEEMKRAGVDPSAYLENNDSYHALEAVGGLIMTGPTGTNVNDVAVALISAE